ncbi:hypothetical protein DFH06DRAFT_1322236 [Mycena polygramma]|nr:hypothetical protein DFH06DRAFT_1322236 [Mycena polygramma]
MPITFRTAMKHWFVPEAIPLVVLLTGMVSFASYFTYRSALGPTIGAAITYKLWLIEQPFGSCIKIP